MHHRLTVVASVAALAATAWLAAPALSLEPYIPAPVEFELRDAPLTFHRVSANASVDRSHGRAANVLTSRTLTAPKRFNLVGLRWRGARSGEIAIRVRGPNRSWSRWARVRAEGDGPDAGSGEGRRGWTVSDPVWAGQADQLQYRIVSAGTIRDLTLHFVNSTGTATPFKRIEASVRRATGRAFASVASLFQTSVHAESAQPQMFTRDQWGASKCPPREGPRYGEVKLAFVHHTVTTNAYAPQDSPAMVLAICRYHRNSNGWHDIGYQFLVDQYGQIFEGRAGGIDRAVVGAQAQGYNLQSTGIASLGTFSTQEQTPAGLDALARLLSWKLALHGVPPEGSVVVRSTGGSLNRYRLGASVRLEHISGHRDGDATSCPGDGLYAQLPLLRSMVSTDTRTPTRLALAATRSHIPYGRKARLTARLTTADGQPVSGHSVRLQVLGGARPATLAELPTGADGSLGTNLRLAFNRVLVAAFAGAPGLRPAQSAALRVGVRPRLTATLEPTTGSRLRAGQRVIVDGNIRPRKHAALLLVDRRGSDGSYRRIVKKALRARSGHVRAGFRILRAGGYRLRLGVEPDDRNLGARSDPLFIEAATSRGP